MRTALLKDLTMFTTEAVVSVWWKKENEEEKEENLRKSEEILQENEAIMYLSCPSESERLI